MPKNWVEDETEDETMSDIFPGAIDARHVMELYEQLLQEPPLWLEALGKKARQYAEALWDEYIVDRGDEQLVERFVSDIVEAAYNAAEEATKELGDPQEEERVLQIFDRETKKLSEQYYLTFLGGAPLIIVQKSPIAVYAPFCSPCVPRTGDLYNVDPKEDVGVLTYAIPLDWFGEDDICRYANKKIYYVEKKP